MAYLASSPKYKDVIVTSIEDAKKYLRKNNIDMTKVEAVYISKKDYHVHLIKSL